MRYHVYTDGATNPSIFRVSVAYLIHTDDTFINLDAASFNSRYIAVAETIAIGLAAQHLLKIGIKKEDEVIFYTDAIAAKNYIMDYLGGEEKETSDERLKIVLKTLKVMDSMCNMKIKKVKAHTMDISGNNIADKLAKMSLEGSRKCLN